MIVKALIGIEIAVVSFFAVNVQIDGEFLKGAGYLVGAIAIAYTTIMAARINQKADRIERLASAADTKLSTTNNRNIGTLVEGMETRIIKDRAAEGRSLEPDELSHMRTVEEQEDVIARPAAHSILPPRPKVPDRPEEK